MVQAGLDNAGQAERRPPKHANALSGRNASDNQLENVTKEGKSKDDGHKAERGQAVNVHAEIEQRRPDVETITDVFDAVDDNLATIQECQRQQVKEAEHDGESSHVIDDIAQHIPERVHLSQTIGLRFNDHDGTADHTVDLVSGIQSSIRVRD